MIFFPYKNSTYTLQISEDEFITKFNNLVKIRQPNYRGSFNDPDKLLRGHLNEKEKKFIIERNNGSTRGFKPFFEGKYCSTPSKIVVTIIIKADLIHYLLFLGGVFLLLALLIIEGKPIYTIHGGLTLYILILIYFHYDSDIILNRFKLHFKNSLIDIIEK